MSKTMANYAQIESTGSIAPQKMDPTLPIHHDCGILSLFVGHFGGPRSPQARNLGGGSKRLKRAPLKGK